MKTIKRLTIAFTSLVFATNIIAQQHVLGIGAQGGIGAFLQETNDWKWSVGGNSALNLEYTCYFPVNQINLGVKTGVTLGFSQNKLSGPYTAQYTVKDEYDYDILYTITAENVKEHDGQIVMAIPILAAIEGKGVYAAVGLKFGIPVYSYYKESLENVNVDAYYEVFNVHVVNEAITGVMKGEEHVLKGKWDSSKFNLMLAGEIGYNFRRPSGNDLALGVYADYSVYDTYKEKLSNDFIRVAKISLAQTEPTAINVNTLTQSYAKGIGYFDFGVKLTYNFNLKK